ncbi:MAG: Cof-type HAD-IIB family hydrolase [Streptosporangiales bacterium]|nr:Cof-type HAD-IIB family hydrolase [Streptosporangiales bacterium]
MEDVRLVATDLDGTVIRSDRTISDRTVAALSRVEASGAHLVLVTGRPPRWMHEIAEATGHRGLAICANGALVYDLRTEEVVESCPIETDVLKELIERLRATVPDLAFAAEQLSGFVHEEAYRTRDANLRVGELEQLLALPAAKLLAQHRTIDPDTLLARARAVVGDLAEVTHASNYGLLEISAAGVSKASALAQLCDTLGVTAGQVLAFGDMPNDLPLLAWAGTSYAVANAHPDVLAAVDHHTASNDEDGVALVLEELFG